MFEEIKKKVRDAAEKIKNIKKKDAQTELGAIKDKTGQRDDPTIQGMVVDKNSEIKLTRTGDSNQFKDSQDESE